MKLKKLFAMSLAVIMAVVLLPVASLADAVGAELMYRKMWKDTDAIWAEIEAVDAEMTAAGASDKEILDALYAIAEDGDGIVSIQWDNDYTFSFVHESGMINAYDVRIEHSDTAIESDGSQDYVFSTLDRYTTASSLDCVLLGPYYGYDSSFTNQYREEVQSVAEYTQGEYTIYSGAEVDADACRAIENYGTIFFDSHGNTASGKSWLCLNSSNGFTDEDYSAQRALRSGNSAWVTGSFWEYYCPNMNDSCVWMAICLGMATDTLCEPLINAGCSVVFGYSQSVTFVGEYAYSELFWNEMKQGALFCDAFEAMTDEYGYPEPYGDAYPVVMSESDPYPSNPDSPQTVYCDWKLPTPSDLVITDATGVSFADDEVGVAPMFSTTLEPIVTPEGANNFDETWTSSDESVATVDRRGNVTGINPGTALITYQIDSTEHSNTQYSYSASVLVTVSNAYLPMDVMYVPTTTIVPGEEYLIGYRFGGANNYIMTNNYFDSNNNRSLCTEAVELGEYGEDEIIYITSEVDPAYEVTFSSENGGSIQFSDSGLYLDVTGAAGNYLCMSENGVEWLWTPTEGADTGVLENTEASAFKYVGISNQKTYFGMFIASYEITLFRKLVRDGEDPNPPEPVIGDVDGDGSVTSSDALLVMRHVLGGNVLDAAALEVADFNGDGFVDTTDALLIMRRAMDL